MVPAGALRPKNGEKRQIQDNLPKPGANAPRLLPETLLSSVANGSERENGGEMRLKSRAMIPLKSQKPKVRFLSVRVRIVIEVLSRKLTNIQ